MNSKIRKIKPSFVRKDNRGVFFEILNKGIWKNLSYGEMKKGASMGNHYHKKTILFFFLISGKAKVTTVKIDNKKKNNLVLKEKEGVTIPINHYHLIKFITDSIFILIKSRKYSSKNSDIFKVTNKVS